MNGLYKSTHVGSGDRNVLRSTRSKAEVARVDRKGEASRTDRRYTTGTHTGKANRGYNNEPTEFSSCALANIAGNPGNMTRGGVGHVNLGDAQNLACHPRIV